MIGSRDFMVGKHLLLLPVPGWLVALIYWRSSVFIANHLMCISIWLFLMGGVSEVSWPAYWHGMVDAGFSNGGQNFRELAILQSWCLSSWGKAKHGDVRPTPATRICLLISHMDHYSLRQCKLVKGIAHGLCLTLASVYGDDKGVAEWKLHLLVLKGTASGKHLLQSSPAEIMVASITWGSS